MFPDIIDGPTSSKQALMQIASLGVTLGFALLGGIIVGKNQGISITSQ